MLKYLIVPLSDNAVSFCHYERNVDSNRRIDIDALRNIITWSMKENLNLQFLYPDEELPCEYHEVINTVDHVSIVGSMCEDKNLVEDADVIILDAWPPIGVYEFKKGKTYVIRTSKEDFFSHARLIKSILSKTDSLTIVIVDVDEFDEEDFSNYKKSLDGLVHIIFEEIKKGRDIHFNLLTSRMAIDKMHNCGAGDECLTFAPDGRFYICPAFYGESGDRMSVGSLQEGLNIKNAHLYNLKFAPLCRRCDAFQCRRCIWLNLKNTLEVNTPSHEQCVVSHIERNASKKLAELISALPGFSNVKQIKEISYLDPFELLEIPGANF